MKFAKRVLMKGGSLKKKKSSKQINIARILLKLAFVNGYNEKEEILKDDGTFIPNSDVIDLTTYALTSSKTRKNIDAFVDLLHKAGVAPVMITNSHVKQMLSHRSMQVPSLRLEEDVRPGVRQKRPLEAYDEPIGKRFKRSEEPHIDWDDDSELDHH